MNVAFPLLFCYTNKAVFFNEGRVDHYIPLVQIPEAVQTHIVSNSSTITGLTGELSSPSGTKTQHTQAHAAPMESANPVPFRVKYLPVPTLRISLD